jgi:DNA mismatch repair protein MutS
MESYNPKEIVIYYGELKTISVDEIMDHLNTNQRIFHLPIESNAEWVGKMPSKYQHILYQNEFFGKVYPEHGFYSPIEYLGLERMAQAALSFLMLLDFAHEHNISILRKVQKPTLWEYPQHLILYHNTMYQLNIISQGNAQQEVGYGGSACWRKGMGGGSRYRSLLEVIQKTSTAMGKRLLKYRLMNPITSSEELERRYGWTEKMMEKRRYEDCQKKLMEMMDMERMHRKMDLGLIHPHEFGSLHMSYNKVLNLMEWMEEENLLEEYELNPETIVKFAEYRREYQKDLNMEEIHKHSLQAITDNFFQKGIVPELDEIQERINENMRYFDETVSHFCNLIEAGSDSVKWDMNGRDGYFMVCTKKRCDVLEKKLSPEERKKWDIKKLQATTVKITGSEWDTKSHQMIALKEKMRLIAKDKYLELMQKYVVSYNSILHEITGFVATIDVVKSAALCAKMYGYHRPKIVNRYEGKSFFSAKKMRHPLIEVLHERVIYIDNDIELLKGNEETGGILLMGLNGVGKSSMAKAIGCNIVMAQMGYFVPCSEFIYYPYEKIFTRINGDDNIFKGMSSFVVEMSELRSILKYADERSIVLGDEVCKGTEETSALSIVSATIQRFSEKGVNFIMATHFHKLCEMEEIQKLKNVVFKHLSVSYDEEGEKIIYGRKLMDGPGDTLYGLEIARHLIKDDEFFQIARKTRNMIVKESDEIVEMKKSNYHSQLMMTECMICKKTNLQAVLHTHHLKEQHEYKADILNIDGVRKDQLGNLVVLCEEHHEDVHHGQLQIDGWRDTVMGRELVWRRVEKDEEEEEEDPLLAFESEIEKLKRSGMEKKLITNVVFEKMKKERGKLVSKKEIEKKISEMAL